jgi:acetyl/propionyl-CoA carboxylase alpha subunit
MTMSNSTTPVTIRRILVANRAEVACRVFRTARQLGIETVAVASDADLHASWTLAADLVVPLGGSTPRESYLDVDKVLAAAKQSGADAIHPGYGFLAEDANFAAAVTAAELLWIGPTPEAMRSMGGKVEAKRIAAAAGVPLVPGAELTSSESSDWIAAADDVGYPLLVKASAGGGGKGMRLVTDASMLVESVETAMREAASAFGDATVFLERFVTPAHHVEVQVFGDTHGNVIHLLDRECSVQRRHQKVIEECPAPGLTDKVRHDIRAAAVSLAASIGYVGAGTVEFVVSGSGDAQEFFFLEMNTRLQVEHPVTELVTGTDLVAWQFAVATGQTLPLTQEQVEQRGSAVEVRLYAEDPAHDWMPGHGRLFEFRAPEFPKLRVDTGVASGDEITTFYDPMLAKVVAHAPTRTQAVATLAAGLRRFTLHGPVTNREALVAVREHDAFRSGDTPTSFFEDHPEVLARVTDGDAHLAHLIAATHHVLLDEQHDSRVPFAPAGWRNIPTPGSVTTLAVNGTESNVNLRLLADGSRTWSVDGVAVDALVVAESPEHMFVTVDGVRRSITIAAHGASLFCDDGLHSTHVEVIPRFTASDLDSAAGGPTTPVPGTITAVLVSVGDRVEAGDALVVLEAMKMEHRIKSDVSGTVSALYVNVGENVDSHHLVAAVAADETDAANTGATEGGETA